MRLCYFCHPLKGSGAPEEFRDNLQRVERIVEAVIVAGAAGRSHIGGNEVSGVVPMAPYLLNINVAHLEESDAHRRYGMAANKAIIAKCDELWILHRSISDGMWEEIKFAIEANIGIRFATGWPI